jgi:catechol 2,3-dioxygenase-like lactoylglutathione lyase family enzyme
VGRAGSVIDALTWFERSRRVPPTAAKGSKLQVKRIVANFEAPDPGRARAFYQDVLGLELLMDHGWIQTYGSRTEMTVQVSFAAEGGSGTAVPDLSIEVDDVDAALQGMRAAGFSIEYGPADEPWGVRRFFVLDPFGKLVNILAHT